MSITRQPSGYSGGYGERSAANRTSLRRNSKYPFIFINEICTPYSYNGLWYPRARNTRRVRNSRYPLGIKMQRCKNCSAALKNEICNTAGYEFFDGEA